MNETCGECGGSGKYVGLIVEESCATCAGTGTHDAPFELPFSRLEEIGEEPSEIKNSTGSAQGELNTWLRKWDNNFVGYAVWQWRSQMGVLGLRLSKKLMNRLGEELEGTYSLKGPIGDWTYQGLTFHLLPPTQEDGEPKIIIIKHKGEESCRSEKESPAYCSTLPLRREVGEAQMKAEADLEREVSRIR